MDETKKLSDEQLNNTAGGFDSGYYYKDYCKYDYTQLQLNMTWEKYWLLLCPTCRRFYKKTKSDLVLHNYTDFIP